MSEPFALESLSYEQVAKTIDHSLLGPELELEAVREGCELAVGYGVASVCARPCDVVLAREILSDSSVKVGTVIGFPHGSSTTAVKAFEAERAIAEGAEELDMVLNIGRLRSGDTEFVRAEVKAVVEAAAGALVKVILENAYLDRAEKILGCELAEEAGAGFVKTSTGFAPSGATIEDIRLMRGAVSLEIGVKAAGGIRTLDALIDALNAGATRIGATATRAILDEYRSRRPG